MNISEALGLFAVGRFLNGHVPVPEVYGWRTDGDEKYLYMEYIRCQTLKKAWDIMVPSELVTICHELRTIYDYLRRLQQDPSDIFVGKYVISIYKIVYPSLN